MHVYVINAVGTDLYKIGLTRRPLTERIAQLQTACPYDLELAFAIKAKRADSLEREIQRFCAPWHRRGEWYELPHDFLGEILQSFTDWGEYDMVDRGDIVGERAGR